MKILIVSDIHANLPALQAVLDKDRDCNNLIFLGDVVDYGPNPKECVKFIRENADYFVRGNHDNALGYDVDCNCIGTFREYSIATREWHKTLLDASDIHFLRNMPTTVSFQLDNPESLRDGYEDASFYMAHASPQGDMFKYLNQNEIAGELEGIIAEYILVGHTHVQYKKKLDYGMVVNPGSVGLARDGGQACSAVYEDGEIHLKRIDYDVKKTISDLMKSPLPQNVKDDLKKVLLHK